jgi:integrase
MGRRGNGEGTMARRKDGRWMGRYTVYTAKGPRQRAVYGRTRQEAAEKLTRAIADRDGGLTFDAGTLTVTEYLDRWLTDAVQDTVRQRTYERYEQIARVHIKPALGRLKLKSLTTTHVRGLYREKLNAGLAPRTVQYIHTTQGTKGRRCRRPNTAPCSEGYKGSPAQETRDQRPRSRSSPRLPICRPWGPLRGAIRSRPPLRA